MNARIQPVTAVIGLLVMLFAVSVGTPGHAQSPDGPHRLGVRMVDGVAEFYDTVTGKSFVPRGANYIDFSTGPTGNQQDWVLATDRYDPARVREAFRTLAARGYNTVRIFFDHCHTGPQCITFANRPGINHDYAANMADLMRIAGEEGIYLLLTSNDIPDGGGYGEMSNREATELIAGYRNAHYLTAAGAQAAADYWDDLLAILVELDAPTEALLGWQLLNEQWFFGDQPPLSLTGGVVTTATGTYDLANPDRRRQMTTDGILYWMDQVTAVIRQRDPDTLITMGFFAPDFPNATEIGGTWVVDTAPLLEAAPLDFFDFHAYPASDIPLAQIAENFGMVGYTEKPVIMGEVGAFRSLFPSADMAARVTQQWIAESCKYGFDGWLYWEYYGQGDDAYGDYMWGMLAEDNLILEALAPANQPDPCTATGVPVANLAFERPATASASLSNEPPAHLTDGTAAQWGAGADAPQWIEIDLGDPQAVGEVRLTVAQWPAGDTHHQLWAIRADGSRVLLQDFAQATREGMVLTVTLTAPLADVTGVRVETLASPSWIAWQEIEVYATAAAEGTACVVSASVNANLRAEPSTAGAIAGSLAAGRGAVVDGQTTGADGFTWWHLLPGEAWVRADVVQAGPGCEAVPEVNAAP